MNSLTGAPSQPLRIFVLENHPDTLKYLAMFLESLGYTTVRARTMKEALAALPSANCDVLVSDIGLPDGSGWELLKHLREGKLEHPPYAIAMSGFGTHADQEKSRAAGYRHHLLKPFDPDELEVMLGEAAKELATSR
jgi:CheY-like chemotaxis protein